MCVFCVQQHALRYMAFGQIYKVLEMEPLPSNKPSQKYPWSDKEGVCICLPACLLSPPQCVLCPVYSPHVCLSMTMYLFVWTFVCWPTPFLTSTWVQLSVSDLKASGHKSVKHVKHLKNTFTDEICCLIFARSFLWDFLWPCLECYTTDRVALIKCLVRAVSAYVPT